MKSILLMAALLMSLNILCAADIPTLPQDSSRQNPDADNWARSLLSHGISASAITPAVVTNVDFQNMAGQLNDAMPIPWTFLYFNAEAQNEGYMTNTILNAVKSGFAQALAAGGSQPAILIDGGWQGTNRWGQHSGNWSYFMTNWGSMTWNQAQFPDGLPWLCHFAHTNGFKVVVEQYVVSTNLTPDIDGYRQSWSIANAAPFTNGVGPWPKDGDGELVLCTTLDTIKQDEAQMCFWGIDGWTINDGDPYNHTYEQLLDILRVADNGALAIARPYGFGQRSVTNFTYFSYNPADVRFDTPWQFMPDEGFHFFFNNMLAVIPYQTIYECGNHDYGNIAAPYQSAGYYDNSAQGTGLTGLFNWSRDYQGIPNVNRGAGIVWFSDHTTNDYAAECLASCHPVDYSQRAFRDGWARAMTNADFMRIHNDPLQAFPQITWHEGNRIAVVVKPLSDGNCAVGFFNNSAAKTNLTVTWPQLHFAAAQNCIVSNIDLLGKASFNSYAQGSFTYEATPGCATVMMFFRTTLASDIYPSVTTNGQPQLILGAKPTNVPSLPIAGALLFSNGTNLYVVIRNSAGLATTNKITMTSGYP